MAQPGRVARYGKPLLAAFAAAMLVAVLGSTVTDLGPWYEGLRKPPWKPQPIVFPIAWTLIYALTALSATIAWVRSADRAARQAVVGYYALNGALNIAWSLLFFRLQRPDWALIEVAFLWLSVAALMVWQWPRARVAALLLVPYLAWVGVAAALNAAVVQLNGPFG